LWVINEGANKSEYISLDSFVSENGGLLRCPHLAKTSALSYMMKFLGKRLLEIIAALHRTGYVL